MHNDLLIGEQRFPRSQQVHEHVPLSRIFADGLTLPPNGRECVRAAKQ